jgi:signal transduction histidine kinase
MPGSHDSRQGPSLPIAEGTDLPEILQLIGPEATVSLSAMLEAMPASAAVLDSQRRIVAANERMLQEFGPGVLQAISGRRLGEVVGCLRIEGGQATCGTTAGCAWCGALKAITESRLRNEPVTAESRMAMLPDRALDIEVRAAPLTIGGRGFTVVTLRDISAEKRRRVLERIFFHDVLNTAGGICGIANVLAETDEDAPQHEFKRMLQALSEQLIEEINSQRQLIAAESGELHVTPGALSVADLLRNVAASWSKVQVATGRALKLGHAPQVQVVSDAVLLRRILGNMVKNALEATPSGGEVTLGAEDLREAVAFHVHNHGCVSDAVRHQIFLRSFSTKGDGRGIGTYSIKLLGEKYLFGVVSFTSTAQQGTTFSIRVPKSWSPPPASTSG